MKATEQLHRMGQGLWLDNGCVRSLAGREQAEHAAWAAPGVTKVEDLITIS